MTNHPCPAKWFSLAVAIILMFAVPVRGQEPSLNPIVPPLSSPQNTSKIITAPVLIPPAEEPPTSGGPPLSSQHKRQITLLLQQRIRDLDSDEIAGKAIVKAAAENPDKQWLSEIFDPTTPSSSDYEALIKDYMVSLGEAWPNLNELDFANCV